MINKSGLKPLGRAVLCLPYEPEIKQSAIVLPESVRQRLTTVDNRVIVVEAGESAWADEPHPRAKPGDKVLIAQFAGHMTKGTLDGADYRVVNDRDIFLQIEREV
jgi:co-chaperonin GroES (HSP10)